MMLAIYLLLILVDCGNVFHALSLVNTQFSVMATLMLPCHSATDAANMPKVTCCASSADGICMNCTTCCHHRCLGTALLTPIHFSTQIKLFNLTLNKPQNMHGLACNLEERHFTVKFGSEKLEQFVLLVFTGGKNDCTLHIQTDVLYCAQFWQLLSSLFLEKLNLEF